MSSSGFEIEHDGSQKAAKEKSTVGKTLGEARDKVAKAEVPQREGGWSQTKLEGKRPSGETRSETHAKKTGKRKGV